MLATLQRWLAYHPYGQTANELHVPYSKSNLAAKPGGFT
jgi:hypothetical protein